VVTNIFTAFRTTAPTSYTSSIMAEETNPVSSPIPATSSNAEMEPPQARIEAKAQDETAEEHTLGQAGEGTADAVAAEGRAIVLRVACGPMQQKLKSAFYTGTATNGEAADRTNGTPASSKKASNGSHKKKSAVPEHKSKKLNKKKSKPLTNLDAQPGQYYFARMKGHPPWPSIVCDEEMLPQSLIETRPVTTKQPDGTYKKPEYADGGKRAYERTFPIMFL